MVLPIYRLKLTDARESTTAYRQRLEAYHHFPNVNLKQLLAANRDTDDVVLAFVIA